MRLSLLVVVLGCSSPQSPAQDPGASVEIGPRKSAAPVVDAGIDAPAVRRCEPKPNPKGCPDTEPNVNASCAKLKLECVYGTSCCKPTYACVKQGGQLRFEARFGGCE